MLLRLVASLGALWGIGCAPEPVFDEELGVQAVPAARGSLAGVFAAKVLNATLVHAPVIGDTIGGGASYVWLRRTFDEDAGTYAQRARLCGSRSYEVLATTADAPDSTYRLVPESEETVIVDHETGTFAMAGRLWLWALQGLNDPFHDPLPRTPDEATERPFSEQIYDLEEDALPGYTIEVTGALSGQIYAIGRQAQTHEGVILGPDRTLGFSHTAAEQVFLGATSNLLATDADTEQLVWPDPKESWFEEVRLDQDADCDEVIAARDDGRLSKLRPF